MRLDSGLELRESIPLRARRGREVDAKENFECRDSPMSQAQYRSLLHNMKLSDSGLEMSLAVHQYFAVHVRELD